MDDYTCAETEPRPAADAAENEYTYKTVRLLTVGCLVLIALCLAAALGTIYLMMLSGQTANPLLK